MWGGQNGHKIIVVYARSGALGVPGGRSWADISYKKNIPSNLGANLRLLRIRIANDRECDLRNQGHK
jgi:hypothetical protein